MSNNNNHIVDFFRVILMKLVARLSRRQLLSAVDLFDTYRRAGERSAGSLLIGALRAFQDEFREFEKDVQNRQNQSAEVDSVAQDKHSIASSTASFASGFRTSVINLLVLLPEDYVANVTILRRRLEKQSVSPWQLNWQLLREILGLLWAYFVQIPLENLFLPSDEQKDRQIDD